MNGPMAVLYSDERRREGVEVRRILLELGVRYTHIPTEGGVSRLEYGMSTATGVEEIVLLAAVVGKEQRG